MTIGMPRIDRLPAQFNARIDQDFAETGEASLIFHYNENRNHSLNRTNPATSGAIGRATARASSSARARSASR